MALGLFSSLIDCFLSRRSAYWGPPPFPRTRLNCPSLFQRILVLAVLFAGELIILSIWLDGDALVQRAALIGIMHDWGAWILRCIIGFAAIFVTFAYFKSKTALDAISAQLAQTPVRWSFLLLHCFAMGLFVGLSFLLYGGSGSDSWANLLAASGLLPGFRQLRLPRSRFYPG